MHANTSIATAYLIKSYLNRIKNTYSNRICIVDFSVKNKLSKVQIYFQVLLLSIINIHLMEPRIVLLHRKQITLLPRKCVKNGEENLQKFQQLIHIFPCKYSIGRA